MRSWTVITYFLLCSLSSISVSESHTVEAQPGEDATLLCSNFSSVPSQIKWYRLVNRTQPRCVSFMFQASEAASSCGESQNGRIEMRSNLSTLFLIVKQVDPSDSGLYFCGYGGRKDTNIVSATYLEVQEFFDENFFDETTLTSVILGGLIVFFLLVIICLGVKIKKLQKARVEEQNAQITEGQGSDELNYATVTFLPKTKRNHQSAASDGQEDEAAI